MDSCVEPRVRLQPVLHGDLELFRICIGPLKIVIDIRNGTVRATTICARATYATRTRPKDDSLHVTTLMKPTKGKYEVGIRVSDCVYLYRTKKRKLFVLFEFVLN